MVGGGPQPVAGDAPPLVKEESAPPVVRSEGPEETPVQERGPPLGAAKDSSLTAMEVDPEPETPVGGNRRGKAQRAENH